MQFLAFLTLFLSLLLQRDPSLSTKTMICRGRRQTICGVTCLSQSKFHNWVWICTLNFILRHDWDILPAVISTLVSFSAENKNWWLLICGYLIDNMTHTGNLVKAFIFFCSFVSIVWCRRIYSTVKWFSTSWVWMSFSKMFEKMLPP